MGNEVDLLCDKGLLVDQIEIKAGQTISKDPFKGLKYFLGLNNNVGDSYLVYNGTEGYKREGIT